MVFASNEADRSAPPLLAPAIVAALLALTFVAHMGALQAGFLSWDDDLYVTRNEAIRGLGPSHWLWMLTTTHASNWHPLTWLSHALVHAGCGLDPRCHHLANVVLHCLDVVWFFLLACVLLAAARHPQRGVASRLRIDRQDVVAAAVAALLFGVHPQHVESVAWVAERKDVLFLFFLLPALLAYVLHALEEAPERRRALYWTAFAAFVLSTLSKSMAVTAPIVMLLLDVYPLRRLRLAPAAGADRPDWRGLFPLLREKLPFLLVSLVVGLLTIAAQDRALIPIAQVGPGLRVLNAINSIALYAWRWAVPLDLSPYYTYPAEPFSWPVSLLGYAPAIAAFLAISAACLLLWRRGRAVWLVLWLFYLVTLAPVLGIVTVGLQSSADRYAYLPTLALHLLAGVAAARLLCEWAGSRTRRAGVALGLAAVVALLMFLTHQQTRVWRGDVSFWERVASRAAAPDAWIVQAGLAKAYQGLGDHERALSHFEAALAQVPDWPGLQHDLALSLLRLGRLDDATATLPDPGRDLSAATLSALVNEIAAGYCRAGRPLDALALARRSLELQPDNEETKQFVSHVRAGGCR